LRDRPDLVFEQPQRAVATVARVHVEDEKAARARGDGDVRVGPPGIRPPRAELRRVDRGVKMTVAAGVGNLGARPAAKDVPAAAGIGESGVEERVRFHKPAFLRRLGTLSGGPAWLMPLGRGGWTIQWSQGSAQIHNDGNTSRGRSGGRSRRP